MLEEVQLKDISKRGVFVETDEPFETGSFIVMDLTLPGDETVAASIVSVAGVVRWRKNESPCGIGIEILQISDFDRVRLETYLDYFAEEAEINFAPE